MKKYTKKGNPIARSLRNRHLRRRIKPSGKPYRREKTWMRKDYSRI